MRNRLLLCILLWPGCDSKRKDTETILLLAPPDTAKDGRKSPSFPPDPHNATTCFNFIFDNTGTLYFYQYFYDKDSLIDPMTVSDIEMPSFIGLTTDRMIILSDAEIKSFVESNIAHVDQAYKSVSIVGMADTIKSKILTTLLRELTADTIKIPYYVRPATLEERVVLDYKRETKI